MSAFSRSRWLSDNLRFELPQFIGNLGKVLSTDNWSSLVQSALRNIPLNLPPFPMGEIDKESQTLLITRGVPGKTQKYKM